MGNVSGRGVASTERWRYKLKVGYGENPGPAVQRNRVSATGRFREAQSHKPIWTIFLRKNVLSNGELESKLRCLRPRNVDHLFFVKQSNKGKTGESR